MKLRLSGVVAAKEFRERIRDRWIIVVALIFAVLALAIAYFGSAQRGSVGFGGIEVTIASLASLAIYLVPLIVLMLGYDAVAGERERGSLDLLLSMPITRTELLLGKYAGLAAAFAASTLVGFGLAGFALAWQADTRALAFYAGFVLSALLMGLAFLSLAVLASVLAADRVRASGVAIATWFFFVLIFDLLIVGLLVLGGGRWGGDVLPYLLLLNPADVFRILNVFGMKEMQALYGLATVAPPVLLEPAVLVGVLLAWIALPLFVATRRFR